MWASGPKKGKGKGQWGKAMYGTCGLRCCCALCYCCSIVTLLRIRSFFFFSVLGSIPSPLFATDRRIQYPDLPIRLCRLAVGVKEYFDRGKGAREPDHDNAKDRIKERERSQRGDRKRDGVGNTRGWVCTATAT